MTEKGTLPNIVLFVADEMRGNCISLGGKHNPVIKTPHIDGLAKEGVAFTNAFTVNPVCGPSRCATFTGQYVHSNAHRSLYQMLQPYEENMLKFLKKKGYEVIWVGRNDLMSRKAIKESVTKKISLIPDSAAMDFKSKIKVNPYPEDHPMRKSFYFGERTKEQGEDLDFFIIQEALEYLDSRTENDKPFCLFIAVSMPHPPYTIEEPYFSMYDRDEVPDPIPAKLHDKPDFMKIMHERYGLNNITDKDFKEIIATYYGMITKVDEQLGQIINKLKEKGEYDNSAFFVFADHGDYVGNYGLTEKWPNAFQDSLINIPLIAKIPGINPKKHILNDLVESIDIFPTVLEIANIKTKYTHFGKDLTPLIKGEVLKHRDVVFAEGGYNPREPQCFEPVRKDPNEPIGGIYFDKTNIPDEDNTTVARSAMVRTKLWKLIIRSEGKEELYDLAYDPSENTNLIDVAAYSKVKVELKEKILRWYLNTSDNAHWRRKREP